MGSAKEVYNEVKKRGIIVDYLINNAGFGNYGNFVNTNLKNETDMIQVNVTSVTEFSKLFLKDMVKKRNGKVMNVASVAGFQPGPIMAVYFATKAYVLHFTEAIGNEVADSGVTVTALCPGVTNTGFEAAAHLENTGLFRRKNLPSAKDVASYGYESMMKGKTIAVHGWKNKIMVNLPRFAPRWLVVWIARKSVEGR